MPASLPGTCGIWLRPAIGEQRAIGAIGLHARPDVEAKLRMVICRLGGKGYNKRGPHAGKEEEKKGCVRNRIGLWTFKVLLIPGPQDATPVASRIQFGSWTIDRRLDDDHICGQGKRRKMVVPDKSSSSSQCVSPSHLSLPSAPSAPSAFPQCPPPPPFPDPQAPVPMPPKSSTTACSRLLWLLLRMCSLS